MNKTITKEEIKSIRFLTNRGYSIMPEIWYGKYTGLLSSTIDYIRDSKEEDEYQKCKKDVNYFASKYIKVLTPNGFVNIELKSHQKEFLESSHKYKKLISNTGPQHGITTVTLIAVLHNAIFDNRDIVLLSHNLYTGLNKFDILINMIIGLPGFLQPGVSHISKGKTEFKSGTKITFKPINALVYDSIRDVDIYGDDAAHFDETSFKILLKNVSWAEERVGKVILTSTGGGDNNSFYKLYQDAKDGINNYTTLF